MPGNPLGQGNLFFMQKVFFARFFSFFLAFSLPKTGTLDNSSVALSRPHIGDGGWLWHNDSGAAQSAYHHNSSGDISLVAQNQALPFDSLCGIIVLYALTDTLPSLPPSQPVVNLGGESMRH
jgi:hypothetical protein